MYTQVATDALAVSNLQHVHASWLVSTCMLRKHAGADGGAARFDAESRQAGAGAATGHAAVAVAVAAAGLRPPGLALP